MLANAGVNVAEIKLAKVSFDAGDFGFGLLVGSAGLGVVLGSLSAGTWVERRGAASVYGFGLLLMAIGIAAQRCRRMSGWQRLLSPSPAPATASHSSATPSSYNVARLTTSAAEVFTVLMSSNYAVFLLGMLVAGPLSRRVWGSVGVGSVPRCAALAARSGLPSPVGSTNRRPRARRPLAATGR